MSTEENKPMVMRHFKEVHEQGELDLIDSYYAPDGSTPDMDQTPEILREGVKWLRKIAPDLKITVLDMIAEGDKVMAYIRVDLTWTSKYASEYAVPCPPLDQPITWSGLELYRIVEGKMVSRIGFYDPNDLLWPEPKTA